MSAESDHDAGDHVELDPDPGEEQPLILTGPGTPTASFYRLLARLGQHGYAVEIEYDGDHVTAYTVVHEGFGGGDS